MTVGVIAVRGPERGGAGRSEAAVTSVGDDKEGSVAKDPHERSEIVLSMQDLRAVTAYAAEHAQEVLTIFERAHPADARPRAALDAA